MKIFEIPVSQIIPYENNPRKNENAVEAVANSIEEFGFKIPVIVNKENVLVAGHTRLKAAIKLGLATVPAIKADDLTEEQINAFRLADNKTAELSGWDFLKLQQEIENLEGVNICEMGFELEEFNVDGFFDTELKEEKEKKSKVVHCPHCNNLVEIEE